MMFYTYFIFLVKGGKISVHRNQGGKISVLSIQGGFSVHSNFRTQPINNDRSLTYFIQKFRQNFGSNSVSNNPLPLPS